ncbi:uncharacterized protein PHALS_14806 [Plasmopara halstedii]|uniref:Uncharacterized protein n=1 Tax=Plasmopara halstedii TaxID=4781 RepID=A0A0N7L6W2_PLAHL|nr:uncharacterized protein PHALS_14806 [Plasmopara halstedii]CEG45387.1 hypothetical protein PHALS_14806 [Plasmopara halstedii]|eukprot:XP_024581756.1 hypothetical protein PHALS_14806 [Plasmopara halstedii]
MLASSFATREHHTWRTEQWYKTWERLPCMKEVTSFKLPKLRKTYLTFPALIKKVINMLPVTKAKQKLGSLPQSSARTKTETTILFVKQACNKKRSQRLMRKVDIETIIVFSSEHRTQAAMYMKPACLCILCKIKVTCP